MISQLTIDHSSSIPLHLQVEESLRKLIQLSSTNEGEMLPKETDIAKRLGIARNTVRQAINKLVQDGLVVRKKRFGTVIQSKVVNTKLESWKSFTQEMNEQGVPFKNYKIKASFIKADKKISEVLGIKMNEKVLKLERLRGSEDGPFVYFISYFHSRIGLTGKEDFSIPLYDMLEKDYSIIASKSKERISAILSNAKLAKTLEIKINDPILYRERIVTDPGDRIIEYNLCYYRADKFTYSIDISR